MVAVAIPMLTAAAAPPQPALSERLILRPSDKLRVAPSPVERRQAQDERRAEGDAVNELLAADRAFSTASAKTDVVSGLSAMFADDVVVPGPSGQFAEGKAAASDALRATADNARSRIEWVPVRGGISADGQHGFTFGYMTLHRPDGNPMPLKYLAYWVKRPEGWRVAAYKRTRAAAGKASPGSMPPALPDRTVPPSTDAAAVGRFKDSLDEAERAFSRDAQRIGLGAAFAQYGSADAVNLGGPNEPGLVVGSENIGRMVSAGRSQTGSAVSWAPDKVIVASSGDLGVTIGMIRRNEPVAGQPPAVPFFTIWRRPNTSAPWRYVAE
jgi:ketosteroid isomerase-like protein